MSPLVHLLFLLSRNFQIANGRVQITVSAENKNIVLAIILFSAVFPLTASFVETETGKATDYRSQG